MLALSRVAVSQLEGKKKYIDRLQGIMNSIRQVDIELPKTISPQAWLEIIKGQNVH